MIIFINGSINSGKSTVSALLSKKFSRVAVVEIDALRAFIADTNLTESIPINLENAVAVIRNFTAHNFDVIVPYPLSDKNYQYMLDNLRDTESDIYCFTLVPQIEKVLADTPSRTLSDWERERIRHHYKSGITKPEFGDIIDTTLQTPEETVGHIWAKLSLG